MGVTESVAYDVVTQKSAGISMPGKWERREAMLQSLGVYYSGSEEFSENCPRHQDIGWEIQTIIEEKSLTRKLQAQK